MARRKTSVNGHHALRDLGQQCCDACGKEHAIVAGTWVILASGAFVCSNDKCWRILANWYKEKEDAKKMDESTAGRTISQD